MDIEYQILFELAVNAGRVMIHAEILQRVWGRPMPEAPGRCAP